MHGGTTSLNETVPPRPTLIAKIFDIYMTTTPGYDDDDAWKKSFYSAFRDPRAVDETLEIMRTNAKPSLFRS